MSEERGREALMNVTVPVPVGRLAEFYRMYAGWLDAETAEAADGPDVGALRSRWEQLASAHGGTVAPLTAWDAQQQEHAGAAADMWNRMSEAARTLFRDAMAHGGREMSVADVCQRLGLERAAVTGTLSWPIRIARQLGFAPPITITKIGDGIWWKLDPDVVTLLRPITAAGDE